MSGGTKNAPATATSAPINSKTGLKINTTIFSIKGIEARIPANGIKIIPNWWNASINSFPIPSLGLRIAPITPTIAKNMMIQMMAWPIIGMMLICNLP